MNNKQFSKTISIVAVLAAVVTNLPTARAQAPGATTKADMPAAYNQLVTSGRKALEAGKSQDALLTAVAAIEKDPKRFEAYVLGALVYQAKGDMVEARKFMSQALTRAPETKKSALQEIAKTLEEPVAQPAQPAASAVSGKDLTGEARRKLEVLKLILADADKANRKERLWLLSEFIEKSDELLTLQPNSINILALRAIVATETEREFLAREAGQKLLAVGGESSTDPVVSRALASLERKGWLTKKEGEKPLPGKYESIVGFNYEHGDGVEKDLSESLKWFRKSAQLGYSEGFHGVGIFYLKGWTVPEDKAEAIKWFEKAAAAGSSSAQFNLGRMFAKGDGVPKDASRAAELYSKAAADGMVPAIGQLGLVYLVGDGVLQDSKKGLELVKRAAERGYENAIVNLGHFYEKGQGLPIDYVEAVKWFQLAAEKNNDEANYRLSKLYLAGLGVEPSDTKALQHLQTAADSGHAEAQDLLGNWLEYGMNGVARSQDRAYGYYRKSADQGYYGAFGSLSSMRGMTEDQRTELLKRCYEAARKAAEEGDVGAQRYYGEALIKGEDVEGRTVLPSNKAEGQAWLDKAVGSLQKQSDKGDAVATMDLAWLYYSGRSVLKDNHKANELAGKAAKQGYKKAMEEAGKYFKD